MTDLPKQLARAEEIARNATQGKWRAQKAAPHSERWSVETLDCLAMTECIGEDMCSRNAFHIATFDPAVALALLAVARDAFGVAEGHSGQLDQLSESLASLSRALAAKEGT